MAQGSTALVKNTHLDVSDRLTRSVNEKASRDVVLGIRPEYVSIRLTEAPGTLPVKVRVIEPVGSEMIVHANLDEQEVVVRDEVNPSLRVGQRVWLEVSRDRILLFDPDSEELL